MTVTETAVALSNRIVRATEAAAIEALKEDAIARAHEVAQGLAGIVVTSEQECKAVTDRLHAVKVGQKAAKAALEGVIAPHKKAIEAARCAFIDVQAVFDGAETVAKAALSRYIQEQERLAREARLAQEREAREAQERARAAAKLEAERLAEAGRGVEAVRVLADAEEAPPMEAPPVVSITKARGRTGAVHTSMLLKVELLDPSAVAAYDPELLKLRVQDACRAYRAAEESMRVEDCPHPSGGNVWHGMRFYREANIAAR